MQVDVSTDTNLAQVFTPKKWLTDVQQRQQSPSPDPLLLHGLHQGRTSQYTVDDLLLLIRELLPRGAARPVHRPPNPEPKTHTKINTHGVQSGNAAQTKGQRLQKVHN